MSRTIRRGWSAAAIQAGLAAVLAAGLAEGQVLIPGDDPARPRALYPDSLVSLNDKCAVRGGTLNPSYKPVYVNGRPIGFC